MDDRLVLAHRLHHDLHSGRWDQRHGHLRATPAIDLGYRIVTSTGE